jgi:hypothetical protein
MQAALGRISYPVIDQVLWELAVQDLHRLG